METLNILNEKSKEIENLKNQFEENQILSDLMEKIESFKKQKFDKLATIENLKVLEFLYKKINDWN